jgi:hypothetical protein
MHLHRTFSHHLANQGRPYRGGAIIAESATAMGWDRDGLHGIREPGAPLPEPEPVEDPEVVKLVRYDCRTPATSLY